MRALGRRAIPMLGVVIAINLGGLVARAPQAPPAAVDISRIPEQVGNWRGRDLGRLDDVTLNMLEPDAYVNREYARTDGTPVHIAVIYGRRKSTFHSPGFCLLGGGWNIVGKSRLRFRPAGGAAVDANRFLLARDGYQAVVLYYYLQGERSSASWVAHQARLAWYRIRGERPVGALVRLTVPVESDAGAAATRGLDLLRRLHPYLVRERKKTGTGMNFRRHVGAASTKTAELRLCKAKAEIHTCPCFL